MEDFKIMRLISKRIVKEDKIEEVIKLFEELALFSLKEEGCISYELYQDEKDSRILTMVEDWQSKDALDKHTRTEHFTRLVPILGELTEKKLDFNIYNKLI
jgi:quinol monooxygenase YgiN